MSTPASISKHPIHPMLVVLPMGLWVFSVIADVIVAAGWTTPWSDLALYTMGGGVVSAVIAAVPGLIDFFYITDPQSRNIGLYHLIVNLSATAIFAFNVYLRARSGPGGLPLALSIVGIALIGVGGWLGGELVYVRGVGVDAAERARAGKMPNSAPRRLRRIV
jgi:uncharacterized membrane protein